MSSTNPVMQRVASRAELWEQFAAAPAARLACWQLDHDSSRMFDVFLELQHEEEGIESEDLFVRIGEPFQDARRYGLVVRESLVSQYEEVRDSLQAEGVAATWQVPPVRRNEDDIDALLAAGQSLQAAHAALVRHVVFVLLPAQIADPAGWREWLQKLLGRTIPEHVRFLITDQAAAPQCLDLCPAEPERVMILRPELQMGTAYLELLRQIPGSGPGFLFRRFFVALGNAISGGNLDLAQRLGAHAARIAQQAQWPHLQASVALMLGGGLMAARDYTGALDYYRQAQQPLQGKDGDAVTGKVALQARFAEASALLAASRAAEAAQAYEQIHALGVSLQDQFAQLEGARMAAYCHELAGNREAAWARNLEAVGVAESMGEGAKQSTAPFAGAALLRLADGRPPAEVNAVRSRLDKLLGAQWEESVAKGGAV